MSWYTFRQNNSGGSFFIDETVDIYVVVEETTMKKAIKRARSITKNHRAYCGCCGDRWDFSEDETEVSIERPTDLDHSAVFYFLDGSRTKTQGPPKKPSLWELQGSDMLILSLLLQHVDVSRQRLASILAERPKLPPLIELREDRAAIPS